MISAISLTPSYQGPSWVTDLVVFDDWTNYIVDGVGNDWTVSATVPTACNPTVGDGNIITNCTIQPSDTVSVLIYNKQFILSQITIEVSGKLQAFVNFAVPNTASISGGYTVNTNPQPYSTYTIYPNELQLTSDLEVQKGSPWVNGTAGLPFLFTILVTNHGPSDVVGVTVVDSWTVDFE